MIRHKDLLKSGGTSTIEDLPKEDGAIIVKVLSVYIIASSLNCFT